MQWSSEYKHSRVVAEFGAESCRSSKLVEEQRRTGTCWSQIPSTKLQITNKSIVINSQLKPKHFEFYFSNIESIWNLEFGIWNLIFDICYLKS